MMRGNINSAKVREAGRTIYLSYRPVQMDGASQPWYVLSVKDEQTAMKTRNMVILAILGSSAAIILISLLIVFFVARTISSPLKSVKLVLEKIKEGDLTTKTTTKSQDEIGEMIRLLNYTQEGIKNLIMNIKKEALSLSDTGNELATNMAETAAAVNEITENIQSIKTLVINQSASVSETHATMEQVLVNINKLDGLVEKQSANISQASSAVEEMAANINSVTATLVNNAENVNTLKDASEAGRSGLQGVAADIQEIARESEGLLEINTVMANIASQTNLLSMNAAIEAAHAGEAGRGFAVVADEIRKLAENSGKQSKTIMTVLKKIKSSIDKITRSTGSVLSGFEAIDTSVKVVSEQEKHIRNAMEEQKTGSRQIVEGVLQVKEVTDQVRSGSHEMLRGSTEVINESSELGKATEEIASSINEMASGAQQMKVAMNHVNDISKKNRSNIALLLEEVARFKV
jgi:methyl-accepting chemotaxis protein